MRLVHNGTGTQWDWFTMGLVAVIHTTGSQKDWYILVFSKKTGTHYWFTKRLVHNRTGSQ